MYLQKVISKESMKKNLFFVGILSATNEKSRIRFRKFGRKRSGIHNTNQRISPPPRLEPSSDLWI
jgi:hypothetical protein